MDLHFVLFSAGSLLISNAFVFLIYKKFFAGKESAGLKFLTLNIFKDVVWMVYWLIALPKTTENFHFLITLFAVFSFFLYRAVIRDLNKN